MVIHEHTVAVGSLTSVEVHMSSIFREAVRRNCAALILAHPHPSSGEPEPSASDLALSVSAAQAGKLVGIHVLDHLVVGRDSYVSVRDRGYFTGSP